MYYNTMRLLNHIVSTTTQCMFQDTCPKMTLFMLQY